MAKFKVKLSQNMLQASVIQISVSVGREYYDKNHTYALLEAIAETFKHANPNWQKETKFVFLIFDVQQRFNYIKETPALLVELKECSTPLDRLKVLYKEAEKFHGQSTEEGKKWVKETLLPIIKELSFPFEEKNIYYGWEIEQLRNKGEILALAHKKISELEKTAPSFPTLSQLKALQTKFTDKSYAVQELRDAATSLGVEDIRGLNEKDVPIYIEESLEEVLNPKSDFYGPVETQIKEFKERQNSNKSNNNPLADEVSRLLIVDEAFNKFVNAYMLETIAPGEKHVEVHASYHPRDRAMHMQYAQEQITARKWSLKSNGLPWYKGGHEITPVDRVTAKFKLQNDHRAAQPVSEKSLTNLKREQENLAKQIVGLTRMVTESNKDKKKIKELTAQNQQLKNQLQTYSLILPLLNPSLFNSLDPKTQETIKKSFEEFITKSDFGNLDLGTSETTAHSSSNLLPTVTSSNTSPTSSNDTLPGVSPDTSPTVSPSSLPNQSFFSSNYSSSGSSGSWRTTIANALSFPFKALWNRLGIFGEQVSSTSPSSDAISNNSDRSLTQDHHM